MTLRILDWSLYLELFQEILVWLEYQEFNPEAVIGIARGGLVPAVMLAHHFRTRALGVVYIQKTVSDALFSEMLPEVTSQGFYCPIRLDNKDVLLVDCIVQSGQSMRYALDVIENLGPSSIKMVSICTHQGVEGLAYFSPLVIEPDDWIVFPWESLDSAELVS